MAFDIPRPDPRDYGIVTGPVREPEPDPVSTRTVILAVVGGVLVGLAPIVLSGTGMWYWAVPAVLVSLVAGTPSGSIGMLLAATASFLTVLLAGPALDPLLPDWGLGFVQTLSCPVLLAAGVWLMRAPASWDPKPVEDPKPPAGDRERYERDLRDWARIHDAWSQASDLYVSQVKADAHNPGLGRKSHDVLMDRLHAATEKWPAPAKPAPYVRDDREGTVADEPEF